MNLLHRNGPIVAPMATDMTAVRRRVWLVGAALALGMLGIGWRAHQIAVVQHEQYAEEGHRQQLRTFRMQASRGDIVDRSYMSLAVTDRVFQIVINPRLIRARGQEDAVKKAIVALVPDVDVAYLDEELGRDKAYRRLRMQLDDGKARMLEEQKLPGVRLEHSPMRVYPRQLLAAHVLGRVNAQGKGNLGIEYGLDESLRGREATSPAYYAAGEKLLVDGFPDSSVSRGQTVVLTIDSAIQAMAEEELNKLVAEWKPQSASVVVLEPSSGEILALASRPTFDPNHPVATLEQTVNQAVQQAFEPGSTMKAITVAAALEEGVIGEDERFFCENGRWQYTDRHSIRDTKASGWLSVTEVLAVSSNICTTKIYERLDKHNLYKWAKRFHFGERPAVELPGATTGMVAPWEKWSDIQGANISFGQGMTASPLQVASAFAVLANDGVYRNPRIVRKVLDPKGNPVERDVPKGERVVRQTTARTVLRMLENVVHSDKGTGKNAQVPGFRVAGKTSTAQKASKEGGYGDQYFASFVGAIPARAPRVVILVSVDEPQGGHYGNEVAAPTFSRLATRVMQHLGVPGEEDFVPPPELVADSQVVQEGAQTPLDIEPSLPGQRTFSAGAGLPSFTGLTLAEALDAAQDAGVVLVAEGTGIAVSQDVPPGPVEQGQRVTVRFEAPR